MAGSLAGRLMAAAGGGRHKAPQSTAFSLSCRCRSAFFSFHAQQKPYRRPNTARRRIKAGLAFEAFIGVALLTVHYICGRFLLVAQVSHMPPYCTKTDGIKLELEQKKKFF